MNGILVVNAERR